MDQIGPNGLKWTKQDQIDQSRPKSTKWSELDQIDQSRRNGPI